MQKKIDNAYWENDTIKQGIKFNKNADGSFFTFRPILSQNLLQITLNDAVGIMNIFSDGNVTFKGNVTDLTDNISLKSLHTKLTELKYFTYSGWFFNAGPGGAVQGTGSATLIKHPNGLYEIHFMFKIDARVQNTTDSSFYKYGINRDAFKSAIGEAITPLSGGYWQCQLPNGTPYTEKTEYGTCWNPNGQFWRPARVYTLGGSIGAWELSTQINDLGNIWTGVCFGKGSI